MKLNAREIIRNPTIDILRALCIVFVVMGHCGFPYSKWLYAFHVPLFFVISGMTEKPFHVGDLVGFKEYFNKKIKRLYVPFVLFSIAELLFHNLLIDLHIYIADGMGSYVSDYFVYVNRYSNQELVIRFFKAFIFAGGSQLGAALWFFKILFFCSIAFKIECILLKRFQNRMLFLAALNLCFYIIGWVFFWKNILLPFGLEIMFPVMIFYWFGFWVNNYHKEVESFLMKHKSKFAVLSFALLCIMFNHQEVDIGKHVFTSPMLLLLTTLDGFVFCYAISEIIQGFKAKSLMTYMGRNTVCVVLLHFLSFKIVNLFVIYLNNLDIENLAAYPVLEKKLWFLYTLVGVFIPLLLDFLYKLLKKRGEG